MPLLKSLSIPAIVTVATVVSVSGCSTGRYMTAPEDTRNTAAPVPLNVAKPELPSKFANIPTYDQYIDMMDAELEEWRSDQTPGSAPDLYFNMTPKGIGPMSGGKVMNILATTLTLGLVPFTKEGTFATVTTIRQDGRELYRAEATERVQETASILFPTALFYGGESDREKLSETILKGMVINAKADIREWVESDRQELAALEGQGVDAYRDWLTNNPGSLLRGQAMKHIASHRALYENLDWHAKNADTFNDYGEYFDEKDALLFVGPSGNRVINILSSLRQGQEPKILAAKVKAEGRPYRSFSNEEMLRLKNLGLNAALVAAMIEVSGPGRAGSGAPTARDIQRQHPGIVSLVINSNSGQYMNPWTSDGVLAEWVDKAINADIGGAVGSAAGAAAGAMVAQKALENVPFGSLFASAAGSKMGEAAGREMAIKASGGEAYIRQTSDQSFRSLQDMARYISTTYAGTAHYQDAIKAADAVYPGLLKAVASAGN